MKDDKKLREVLQQKIYIIKNQLPRTVQKDIEQHMFTNYNIKSARTIDIFNGFEPIESIPYHMLYKLTISIKEVLTKRGDVDTSDLNENIYFNENEIPEYSKTIENKQEDFDIIIKDWHQTNVGQYSYITIYTDIDEVIKWRDYNKLRFNPETQRDLIVIETNGVLISKLDINDEAVKIMKTSMLDGSYFPVAGTLNINPELYDEYPIKIKNGSLIIEKKYHIDLVEGFHNYLAETQAKDENSNFKYPCEFRLYLLNKEDANRYILQMDKKNHFKETQSARMDTLNGANYFIKTLNTSSSFNLRGTITEEMFLYLFKILSKMFTIDKIPEAAKLLNNSISKLNYVIMKTDHFDIPFNKDEWFIYLYLIKQSIDKNINFENLVDNIGINSILSEVKIKNEPLKKHYNILNSAISEVKTNV